MTYAVFVYTPQCTLVCIGVQKVARAQAICMKPHQPHVRLPIPTSVQQVLQTISYASCKHLITKDLATTLLILYSLIAINLAAGCACVLEKEVNSNIYRQHGDVLL